MYYFFTVAPDHRSAKKSAAAIIDAQHHQWSSQDVDINVQSDKWIRPFSDLVPNNFKDMTEKDFNVTFWIGHSNTEEFGEFTADQFVDKFVSEFQLQFDKNTNAKLMVKHIYLISCEVGLPGWRYVVFAQAVADKLCQKGFKDVIVHAVASPPVEKMQMLVSVVTVPRREQEISGEVSAILCTYDQGDELNRLNMEIQLIEQRKKPTEEDRSIAQVEVRQLQRRRDIIKNESRKILLTHNIKLELDRRQNLFHPQAPDLRPEKNFDQELVLVEIEKMKFKYSLEKDQDKINQLKTVADCIAAGDEHTWRNIFFAEVEKVKPRGALRGFKIYQHKLYLQLLDLLNRNKLANTITSSASDAVSPYARAAEPVVNATQNTIIDGQTPKQVDLSLPSLHNQEMSMSPLALLQLKNKKPYFFNLIAAKKKVEEHPAAKRLNHMANHLDNEANNAWINSDLKRYKAEKLRKLAAIINSMHAAGELDDAWLLAIKASLLDRKLVSGVLTHRTKDLLLNIIRDFDLSSEKMGLLNHGSR